MTLVRWNPARDLATMEIDRLNRMFGDFFDLPAHRSWVPAVDVYETDSHEYVIKAELPEIKREDISITFDNNMLSVKGERKVEQRTGGTVHRLERRSRQLRRDRSRCRRLWTAVASAPATRMACSRFACLSARTRSRSRSKSQSKPGCGWRTRDPGCAIPDFRVRDPIPDPHPAVRIPHTGSLHPCRGSRSAAFSCTLLGPCPTLSIRTTPPRRLRRSPPRQSPVAFSSLTSRRSARNSFVAARCRVSNVCRPVRTSSSAWRWKKSAAAPSTTRCPKTSKASSDRNARRFRDLSLPSWELLRAPRRNSPLGTTRRLRCSN